MRETQEGPEPPSPRVTPTTPSTAANPIRLLLVDDKVIVREGVRALLEREAGLHVIAQAASVTEAIALNTRPDVVITDFSLPDARGDEVVMRLQRKYAHAGILVLVDGDSVRADQVIGAGAGGGVHGYVLKTATAAEFLSGLRTVAQGVHYVHPALRPGFASPSPAPTSDSVHAHATTSPDERTSPHERRDQTDFAALTEKEREVMDLLVLGHTNAEIAVISKVSLRTVEARRARVLQKLGVRTRADLVRVARRVF